LLVRARTPFDVIDDQAIEEGKLDRYQLLVLPTAACLSNAECAAIAQFVRQGGKVIADFETSHYDEIGRRQKAPGLAEVFGVESLNEVFGPRRWDFARVAEPRPYVQRLGLNAVPATAHNLRVAPSTARTVMTFSAPVISNLPDQVEFTGEPFLVENAYGAGRCYFFPGTLGEVYLERRFPAYQWMIEDLVTRETSPLVRIKNCPHLVEVDVRNQPGRNRRLVHLVNYELSGLDHIVPATELELTVEVAEGVRQVRALRAEIDLAFTSTPGQVSFTLPRLEEFEVILLSR
jgi:hypothetical protein